MDTWQISPILERYFGSASYALVAVLICGLLAAWILSILFTRISTWRRIVLAVLRILAIIVLIVAMLRPERVYTELRKQSATLAILVDQSRSMTLDDTLSGISRWQLLRDSLQESQAALASLAEDVDVPCYAFGEETEEVTLEKGRLALEAQPAGEQSAYGRAMREVIRLEDGKRLIGFILAGDGAQQTLGVDTVLPENVARLLAQHKCPLYTVAFGGRQGESQARDIVVESMPDDLVVFAKNRLTVTGTLRVSGYVNQDLPVQLIVQDGAGDEKIVTTESYRATKDGEQLRYQLSYVPEQPGEYKLILRAVAQEGEATTTNNELPTYLTVLAGGLRVLYLQGELRREQRFLRRALAASPDIDVTLLTMHTRDRDRWPTDLSKSFEPGAFDVYILGDLDSAAFRPADAASGRPADLDLLAEGTQTVIPYSDRRPALLARSVGMGRVLVMTTPLGSIGHSPWNHLLAPKEEAWPGFVLVNGMAEYLVGSIGQRLNYQVGEAVTLQLDKAQREYKSYLLSTPDGTQRVKAEPARNELLISATATTGQFRIEAGGRQGVRYGFSTNVPRDETRLERVDVDQLKTALPDDDIAIVATIDQLRKSRKVTAGRSRWEAYPWLIVLLVIVVAAENLLATFFYRKSVPQPDRPVTAKSPLQPDLIATG